MARYLRRLHRHSDPKKSWLTFLHNHREAIVALDFFTVPNGTFRLLYCLFVIEHGRRRPASTKCAEPGSQCGTASAVTCWRMMTKQSPSF